MSKVQTNLSFMLRPEYENNNRILIITIPGSEIEIVYKTASWVWDLLVITTKGPLGTLQTKYEWFLVSGFIEDFHELVKNAKNSPYVHEK